MGDHTLRDLERRWLETRTRDDEARYLRERVRAGGLSRERLEILAWLGHEPAAQALGTPPPAGEHVDWDRWGGDLDAAGGAIVIAAHLRALETNQHRRRVEQDDDEAGPDLTRLFRPPIQAAADAIRAWCACPCQEHLEAVGQVAPAARQEVRTRLDADEDVICSSMQWVANLAGDLAGDTEYAWVRSLRWVCLHEDVEPDVLVVPLLSWALGPQHTFAALMTDPAQRDAAEADFLKLRLEEGELPLDRLRLAVYAGHRPALMALSALGEEPPQVPAELGAWLLGLRAWDPELATRGVLMVAGAFVYSGPEADLEEGGLLRNLVGRVAARDLIQEADALVNESQTVVWEGSSRFRSDERDPAQGCREAASRIEAQLSRRRWALVPAVRQRLRAWVRVLRVWDDLETAAQEVAALARDAFNPYPRWSPTNKVRRSVIDEVLEV